MSDKIQNLSDAIRMGAALTDPIRKRTLAIVNERVHTCAIGSAAYSIDADRAVQIWRRSCDDFGAFVIGGYDETSLCLDIIEERFPWTKGIMIDLHQHVNGMTYRKWVCLRQWIVWNFDMEHKTREQIAEELQKMGL